jgi:hypothetical protein
MIIKTSNFVSSRRQFLKGVLPTGTLFCFGCSNLLAMPFSKDKKKASTEKHKFLEDSGFTYKDVYEFAFRDWLIPHMQNLSNEIGQEKFIKMLKESSAKIASQSAKQWAESIPKNDFATFVTSNRNLLTQNRFWKNVLSHEIVKQTENEYEVKFTECLWAKTFREANASDIGYASSCYQDYAYSTSYNPKLKLIRDKTLMQGEDFCHFRWIWEG